MKYVGYFFYYLIQFTWGIIQNLIGLGMLIAHRKERHAFYHGSCCTYHNGDWGGVSLGIFIFVNGNRDEEWTIGTETHEYGHTIQSLILGPLYLLIIGIPSMVWCNNPKYIKLRKEKGVSYFDFYPEKWANKLGAAVTKNPIPKR